MHLLVNELCEYFKQVISLRFMVRGSIFWTKPYLPCRFTYLLNTKLNIECSYISFSQSSFYEFRTVRYSITAKTHVFKYLCKLKPDWLLPSWIRKRFPLYPVECRVLLCNVWSWIFLSSYHIMAAFEIRNLGIFWKINLDETVWIHPNNLVSQGLN